MISFFIILFNCALVLQNFWLGFDYRTAEAYLSIGKNGKVYSIFSFKCTVISSGWAAWLLCSFEKYNKIIFGVCLLDQQTDDAFTETYRALNIIISSPKSCVFGIHSSNWLHSAIKLQCWMLSYASWSLFAANPFLT